jgi:hypothetical protein
VTYLFSTPNVSLYSEQILEEEEFLPVEISGNCLFENINFED